MPADFSEFDAAHEVLENANDCPMMCRALASLRRAADGICRISGDDSDDCRRARTKAAEAARKVAAAGCHCNGDPPVA